jgi:hypothetical protein
LQQISPSTVVARSSGLIHSHIDDEVVALNIESGVCYGLNGVGSRIWSLLESPVPISRICMTLVAEYDVDPTVCESDVLDLIEQLHSEKLVIVDR